MIKECLEHLNESVWLQSVYGFAFSAFFAPISKGIVSFIIFVIFYELIVFYATRHLQSEYRMEVRVAANVSGIIGWVLSRYLFTGTTF